MQNYLLVTKMFETYDGQEYDRRRMCEMYAKI